MKILFYSDNFYPETNAPASRLYEHGKYWTKEGAALTVVTTVPNYTNGEIYPGYKNKFKTSETINNINVIRLLSYVTKNSGIFRRIFDYLSYSIAASFHSFFVAKHDVVVGTSPQFFTLIPAFITSRLQKIPYVIEVRDMWPESITAVGAIKNKALLMPVILLANYLYKKADKIIVVTNSFKRQLINNGIPESKIFVAMNGVDLNCFKPYPVDFNFRSQYATPNQIIFGYVGTIGLAHSLESIVQAFYNLCKIAPNKSVLLVVGDGANLIPLKNLVRLKDIKNVYFIGHVDKLTLRSFWNIIDYSIVHLKKCDTFESVIPSKLFESIGMGVPVLHGVTGESSQIVSKYKIGFTFENENVDDATTLMYNILMNKLSVDYNCIKDARNYFSRDLIANEILKVLKSLCYA